MGICRGISTKWLFIHCFQIELEFRSVDFCGGRKTGEPGKTLGAGTRINNKLNTHMTPGPGIKPGPHWWETSALTTAPSLQQIIALLIIVWLGKFRKPLGLKCAILFATMLFWKVEIRRLEWFRYIDLHSFAGCRLINLSLDWRRLRLLSGYCGFYFTGKVDCFAHFFGWRLF